MGRRDRSCGGGGLGGGINGRVLSQAMDSCGKDLSTAEEIVDDLRSRHGTYERRTRQVLLRSVRRVLNARKNNNKRTKDDNKGDDGGKMKKQKRVDEKEEEKLQLAEQTSHLKKRKTKDKSVSSSSSSSDISETWEDFDLISDSIRDNYAKMNNSPSAKKPIVVEKNVEVETVSRSKMTTMGGLLENEARVSPPPPPLSGTNNNKGGRPTFKDFGGIKGLLLVYEYKRVLMIIIIKTIYQILTEFRFT